PEVTGGYFTKTDKVDADETIAWSYPTATGKAADFLHEQPKQEDVTTQQTAYIKSVFDNLLSTTGNQNSSITNGYPSVIDIPSFVDFMIINELASNVDAYQYSTFFHKDRGGKLRAGPVWDFNLTYGNDFGSFGRSRTDVWQFDNGDNVGPAFWKRLFDNPEFNCYLGKRWQDLTASGQALDYAALDTEINVLGTLLAEAKVREQQRWNTLGGYDEEITNLKSWLQDRYTFLNANLNVSADCNFPDTPALVISKIHYHPVASGDFSDDDLEYIGITNNTDATIVLTGMYFRALGVSYQFSEGSTLAAGDILYLVNTTQAFEDFYGIPAFGEYFRDLSNKSQQLQLADAFGNTIDDVTYADTNPWPEEADGSGPHLVLNDLNSDNSLGINWSATGETLGIDEPDTNVSVTKIFPNPSKGLVFIENKSMPIKKVQVYDLLGRLVLTTNGRSNKIQLDLSKQRSNIYILKITLEDDSSLVKKVSKQ
ncbi:MAG: CotH kinase family protein, partial [Aquaticitalea sp.]